MRRPRALLVAAALLGMGAAGFYLRLRHNGYGLPYVYNYDEATHFTNHSVHMLGSDLDPGYYQNPSGFTYLGYFALRGVYGLLGAHLHYGTIGRQFKGNDTPIFEVTRGLAEVLAMAGVATVFWVGRRVWGPAVGLVAAALVAFAITTPYFFAHPVRALYQIKNQASAAGGTAKLGQSQEGGLVYYLKSFTWGFGWAAIAAAIAGAVLELRRDRRRALMLLSFPVVLYIYMGAQSRYFG